MQNLITNPVRFPVYGQTAKDSKKKGNHKCISQKTGMGGRGLKVRSGNLTGQGGLDSLTAETENNHIYRKNHLIDAEFSGTEQVC